MRRFPPPTAVLALISVLFIGAIAACGASPTPIIVPTRTRRPTSTPTPVPSATPIPSPTPVPTRRPTPVGLPGNPALGDAWVRSADGMAMVYVPAGAFGMGASADDPLAQEDEIPQHTVTLDGFWIDRTEVTNAQFARCVAAGVCPPPFEPIFERHRDYYENPAYGDYPVIYVSWKHAHDYCLWAGGALPTEAQWEYAARGPQSLTYPWGNEPPSSDLLNFHQNTNDTTPVGTYPDGASWCGALDMAGNVYEWVADWYGRYSSEPQTDPTGPAKGIGHVLRGGSWHDEEEFVRAANRYVIREAYRDYKVPTGYGFNLGFRCAVTP
jgi:formylglycine-generating enzyme required for sulfatase activity